jgi:CubicO group peptidase (beta-lactamase class C family)
VQDKVIDYFPDAVIVPGQENKRDMTIEHLLTMTSGIVCDTDEEWAAWNAPGQADCAKAVFELPQATAPGTKYVYDNAAPSILLGIIARAAQRDVLDYAQEKLFGPLGMTSVRWNTAPDGLPYGAFGISMTPRDMARFGYLYLNCGRWEDQQLLPAAWVAVTPPKAKALLAYGYLFWNYPLQPFDSSYEANGMYGQYIEILPEQDIVIVRTGQPGPVDVFIQKLGIYF